MRIAVLALLLATSPVLAAAAQNPAADREAVRRTALDYVEGFYEGDSTKHIRSIRPEVYKYGFARQPDSTYRGMQMQWAGFHAFTNRVRTNKTVLPPSAPKQIDIFEVLDQTANVKVTAWWGVDYLLMAKFDGKWMVTHVLWQSPPLK